MGRVRDLHGIERNMPIREVGGGEMGQLGRWNDSMARNLDN